MGCLNGTTALVTGGSRGLGEVIARSLARNGARVAVAARSFDAAGHVAAECGADSVALQLDVTDEQSCTRVVTECVQALSSLDVLVNNAGVAASAKFVDRTRRAGDVFWRLTSTVRSGCTGGRARDARALPRPRHLDRLCRIRDRLRPQRGLRCGEARPARSDASLGHGVCHVGVDLQLRLPTLPAYGDDREHHRRNRAADPTLQRGCPRPAAHSSRSPCRTRGRCLGMRPVASAAGKGITGQGIQVDGGFLQS